MKNSNNTLLTVITLLVLMWFVTSLMGCGFQRALRTHCKIGDAQMCDELFGVNQYEVDSAQDAANKALAAEVASIKQTVDNLINDIKFIESQLLSNNTLINLLQQDINSNYTLIEALQQNTITLTERLDYQQVIINNHQIELTQLATEDTVVEYLDPCGNGPGFDEVLLHTRSGKYVAYFESGSNRFLTVLQLNVSYRTTDSQKCFFTINNDGQIVNEQY